MCNTDVQKCRWCPCLCHTVVSYFGEVASELKPEKLFVLSTPIRGCKMIHYFVGFFDLVNIFNDIVKNIHKYTPPYLP